MKVETEDKESVFFDDNLDVVMFWLRQIAQAKKFYEWYQSLIKVRYSQSKAQPEEIKDADSVLNQIMQLGLPEIDRDQYNAKTAGVAAWDYAINLALRFKE